MQNTRFKNKLRAGTAMAVICAAGLLASTPAYADCVISGDGLTLTCSGDLSGGDQSSSNTVTNIVFNGLTTNIGGNGFSFINTTNADIDFDANLGDFNIVLPDNAVVGLNDRRGFHIISGGQATGTLLGSIISNASTYDLTGAPIGEIEHSATSIGNPFTVDGLIVRGDNFAVIGMTAQTGIDLTHQGDINFSRSILDLTHADGVQFSGGLLAGIRTDNNTENVNITNTGDIAIDGGLFTANVTNTSGTGAIANHYFPGAQALSDFDRLRNSTFYGILPFGGDDVTITQIGNITLTGGGSNWNAEANDSFAIASAAFSHSGGINVQEFHPTQTNPDGSPVQILTGDIFIDVTGDINISGGDVLVTATATSSGSGQTEGRAVASASPIPLEAGRAESRSSTIGIFARGPRIVNVNLDGDINVIGPSATAIATASLGGANETSGEAEAVANASDVSGIFLDGNEIDLLANGAINVAGGDARAEITGIGREESAFDFVGGGGASGGSAEGIRVSHNANAGTGDFTANITGPINVRGGNSEAIANGSGYSVYSIGGNVASAVDLDLGGSGIFSYVNTNAISAIGGDALLTISGTDISGSVTGGDAQGINISVDGDRNLDFRHSGTLTVSSGNAHVDNNVGNMQAISGRGGEAVGLLLGGNNSGIDRVTIDGTVNVTAGSATATGLTENLVGGFAAGVLLENGTEAIFDVSGSVIAAGGTGPDGIDELLGAGMGNSFGIIVTNSTTVNVSGRVEANGASGAALISLHNDAANGFFNVNNSGVIRGPIGIQITGDVDTTITNSGDIIGTGAAAILLAGGDDIINHDATLGTIIGLVDGGGGNNIFNLSGGAYDITNVMNFGALNVMNAGIAQGIGNFASVLNVESGGTLSPGGTDIGTLNLQSLVLADGSFLRFDLGAPDIVGGAANDLVEVAGDLTLDGTLDIFARPDFGSGIYRLFNYGGTLTDNGLEVGMTPSGGYDVQTSVAGQINLLVDISSLEFWDGTGGAGDGSVSGGTGVWTTPSTNWANSDGTQNGDFSGAFAIFMGTSGTVTVEGTQGVTGLQFAMDGYSLVAGTDGAVSLNDAESFIRVDPGVTATLDVPLVGDGRLVKRDTGTLVLSGTNTHAGGTEVREGMIEITSDDNLGAGASAFTFNGGTLRAGGALTLAREMNVAALGGTLDDAGNAITLSGMLTGGGTLTKTGSGALTLTGDSSAFAGDFMLSSGSLKLDGMLGGVLNVGAGTTLSGIGTAGNLDISGTLAVGNSIGTLTTTGDVTFRMGSGFQVELAADGTNDLLNVGGAATIEGGTLSIFTLAPETVYTDGQTYTVLSAAGGLTGQFSQLVENSVFLDFTAAYGANDLVITLEKVLTFPDVANTFNQTQASTGLMQLGQTIGSDSLAVYNALLILDGSSARNAFDLSSGEIYAGIVAADQRQARAHSDKFVSQAWRSGAKGLGAWGNVSVQDGNTDLDGNGADLGFDRQSIDLGIDYRGADNTWLAGVSAGWSDGDVSLAARNSAAKTDSWQMGAYGRAGTGREGPSAGAAINLSKGNADVARNINFPSINRTATSSADTKTTALAAQARYGKQIGTSNWVAGPIASVSYANSDLDPFSENGANALNLSGSAESKSTVYSAGAFANWQGEKGFLDTSLQYGSGDLGRAEASLRLDGASNTPFLVRAAEHNNDRVIAKVSGALNLGNEWSLATNARAEWASKDTNISAGITARKTF